MKKELEVRYDREEILAMVDCKKEHPNYPGYLETFREMEQEVRELVRPVGWWVEDPQEKRVYCMVTLGGEVDRKITEYFDTYDYLKGMLLNALGDCVLFDASEQLYRRLREEREAQKSPGYLSVRQEPGQESIPMENQKRILEKLEKVHHTGLEITSGFMLRPGKSMAYHYDVTEEDTGRGLDHDCSRCSQTDCPYTKHAVRIHSDGAEVLVTAKEGTNLLTLLRQHNVKIEAPCNGMGVCGKCKVEILVEGRREEVLSCLVAVKAPLEVFVPEPHGKHVVIQSAYADIQVAEPKYRRPPEGGKAYGIAVDLGTTSLVVALVDLYGESVVDTRSMMNPQRAYGADVMSRIQYDIQDKEKTLGRLVKKALGDGIRDLLEKNGIPEEALREMALAGNTTMQYLLAGIPTEELGHAPFHTVEERRLTLGARELFGLDTDCPVTLMPVISAYVGGDIVAGLYALEDLERPEKTVALLDIGTNGEMVLKAGDSMVGASTAAGPAFEGVNIRCGMSSVTGAIRNVEPAGDGFGILTIGDGEAKGICGSGLVDLAALLWERGQMDETGRLETDGPVRLTDKVEVDQQDIRQLQLAKSAIRAGLESLVKDRGIALEDLELLQVAGGFGNNLDLDSATAIGLLPKVLQEKVVLVGNTSLAGCVKYLLEAGSDRAVDRIKEACGYLELSTSMDFYDAYITHMGFGND
ncbi:ASKHA domain-containing protein [Anaerotalea alkaliphila]|uniref:DUF4445 domain-containing protein n=1 Tax=Anaerotalea alkaliphila TaxID=2662126 RepID=A0A7X5HTN7_9FIRM|nr:ASKHA domain-containing protein [Anaerotalea alkaliphila]NDL66456.1 DUF4445 domain-containing protein [Anaerotalea alkaliphila]